MICAVLFITASQVSAQSTSSITNDKDRKNLKNEFGVILPKHVLESRSFKLPKSKVIYLLVKMSEQAALEFYSNTVHATRPQGVRGDVNGPECSKSYDCTAIGMVFSPDDEPDDVEKWQVEHLFKSDTIAVFTVVKKSRLKGFVSFFMDTEKGLLVLWYKT